MVAKFFKNSTKNIFGKADGISSIDSIFAKGQTISKVNYGILNSSTKQSKLTILSKEEAQDSEFRSFFGRIEETINCFRDLLTFKLIS